MPGEATFGLDSDTFIAVEFFSGRQGDTSSIESTERGTKFSASRKRVARGRQWSPTGATTSGRICTNALANRGIGPRPPTRRSSTPERPATSAFREAFSPRSRPKTRAFGGVGCGVSSVCGPSVRNKCATAHVCDTRGARRGWLRGIEESRAGHCGTELTRMARTLPLLVGAGKP